MSSKQIYLNYNQIKEYLISLQDDLKITNTSFYFELVEHSLTSEYIINLVKKDIDDISVYKIDLLSRK